MTKIRVLVVVLALLVASAASAQPPTNNIIDQTVVSVDDLLVTVNATGEIEPLRVVPLSFGMGGVVSEILVTEGQIVEEGDVLARLDARELELAVRSAGIALQQQQVRFEQLTAPAREEDIAVAEAALNAAQASANAAYAAAPSTNDIAMAELQAELARNQLWQAQIQRDQALATNPEFRFNETNDPETQAAQLNSGLEQADIGIAIAETNLEGTRNDGPDLSRLGQANASIVQASIQLDNLVNGPDAHDIRMAEIALENSELAVEKARLQLDDTMITAPFDGVITANNLVLGALPPTGQPAFELADASEFVVKLMIDETDVVQLNVGLPVTFDLDALPEAGITGTINRVSLMPVQTGAVPVYEAEVTLDPTLEPIRVGMSTTASIILDEITDAVVVPNRFIRLDRATQQATVTVLDENNRTREVVVTLGARNDTHSQILSGVEAGQQIVLVDSTSLPDGFGG